MAYQRRTRAAYGPRSPRHQTRLHLLPESIAYLEIVGAAMESLGSLAPSKSLAVTLGLELLASEAKRNPAKIAKRLRALSGSPERLERGDTKLPSLSFPGVLDSLRLSTPPTDPGETCFNPTVDIADDAAGEPSA